MLRVLLPYLGGARVRLLLGLALLPLLLADTPTPAAMLLPPGRLVVADLRGHALLIIPSGPDGLDPAATARIPLPGGPHELLPLPDGRVAVSLEQFGRLAVVDLAAATVEVVETGGLPHGLALRPAAAAILVTDRAANAIRTFDLETWSEGAQLTLGPQAAWPHAVALLPDDGLAVALASAGTLLLGGRRVPVGALPETVAVAADGRVATAGALDGTIEVFAADGTSLARAEAGGRPVRVAFDPAGQQVAAALSAASAVALLDTATGQVRRVAVAGTPDGLAYDPSGRWLFASDLSGGALTIVDTARAEAVVTLPVGISTGALLFLPR